MLLGGFSLLANVLSLRRRRAEKFSHGGMNSGPVVPTWAHRALPGHTDLSGRTDLSPGAVFVTSLVFWGLQFCHSNPIFRSSGDCRVTPLKFPIL